jgi:hypothetical protein
MRPFSTTDVGVKVSPEEIQEGKDTATSVGNEIEEEVDAQDEGSNQDGE